MAANSISLVLMVFSYLVIIYKVRKSAKAIKASRMYGNSKASVVRPQKQVNKKEMALFIQVLYSTNKHKLEK